MATPTNAHWAAVKALFGSALELQEDEREAFCRRTAENQDVLRDVLAFLATERSTDVRIPGEMGH